MKRLLRALAAILALPVVVTVGVPALLLAGRSAPPAGVLARGLGLLLGGAGLVLAGWTVSLFFSVGHGTLAPWDPPRRLVVRGPYQHVRNPMITGVLAILLGEAAWFWSPAVLAWAGVFLLINAVYLPVVEEPNLAARFGADYAEYCRHVPRWLPRWSAWKPQA